MKNKGQKEIGVMPAILRFCSSMLPFVVNDGAGDLINNGQWKVENGQFRAKNTRKAGHQLETKSQK